MTDKTHIVCPHCNATNRLPTIRLQDNPACGKCNKELFIGKPVDLNQQSFTQHISKNDIPVVVDFWAPWCGPCQSMAPAFVQAAAQLEPGVRLAKVDTEQQQQLAGQYAIRSIPTLIIFKNGLEVNRQSGAMDANSMKQWIINAGNS